MLAPLGATAQTAGTCVTGTAASELSVGNVRAGLFNTGGLFWKGSQSLYNVPKSVTGTPSALFAAGLWVGGKVNGTVRAVAADYANWELWPGPLTSQGTLPNASDCTPYDRIFRITRADLDAYAASGATTADLREWPVAWGAPVVDGDGIAGNYNLAGGDRPQLWGDETAWWVMNDVGGVKRSTGTAPMGLEVRVTAFATAREGAIGNITYYRYTLVNRGAQPFTDAYVGFWSDPDLGNASDDYIGSDSARNLAYVYNSDNTDEGETFGYGTPPPALGLLLLGGPLVDAPGQTWTDPDGTVYPDRRRLGLSSVMDYGKGTTAYTGEPPDGSPDWYRYLTGVWRNGEPIRACGNGHSTARSDCPATRFQYSGDPESGQGWTERNLFPESGSMQASIPSDRRLLANVGPFTMQPGEVQTVTAAYVWARGRTNLNSVDALRRASDAVRSAWQGAPPATALDAPRLRGPGNGTRDLPVGVGLSWHAAEAGGATYEVQIDTDPAFSTPTSVASETPGIVFTGDGMGTVYAWRVRARTAAATGPWSAVWTFSTRTAQPGVTPPSASVLFLAVANAAGPLAPPEPGALELAGYPTVESFNGGPSERQQSTVSLPNGGWAVATYTHFDGSAAKSDASFAEWKRRAVVDSVRFYTDGRAYEWRFVGSSVARRGHDGDVASVGATMNVPFQLWDVGTDLESSADDVRLIPVVCEAACGAGTLQGVFDIGGDSPVSGADNDPLTDAVDWHSPVDRTPGTAGYDRWSGSADPSQIGAPVLRGVVLVGWNLGTSTANYRMEMPETGTVFRIVPEGATGTAPVLLSPAPTATLDGTTATLLWLGDAPLDYEVATDAAFASVVRRGSASRDDAAMGHDVADLVPGQRYHLRARLRTPVESTVTLLGPWSDVRTFTTGTGTAGEGPAAVTAFGIGAVRPHPVRGIARVGVTMAADGAARVEVFDLIGRRVAVPFDGALAAGASDVALDVAALPSGVYVLRVQAGGEVRTRPLVVAR